MLVYCEWCVLSGTGLYYELISRPEESYWVWCVVVCDLETWWMRTPWPTVGCRAKNKNKKILVKTTYQRRKIKHQQRYELWKIKTTRKLEIDNTCWEMKCLRGKTCVFKRYCFDFKKMCFCGSTENTDIMRALETQKCIFSNDQKFI